MSSPLSAEVQQLKLYTALAYRTYTHEKPRKTGYTLWRSRK